MTDEHDQPTLPPSLPTAPAPPAPSLPEPTTAQRSVPEPAESAAGPSTKEREREREAAEEAMAAAIRNVPTSTAKQHDYGLPTKQATEVTPFVRPEVEPMRFANLAFVIGRGLFVAAALLVWLATRRLATARGSFDEFWAVVLAAGVFVAVGLAGQALWAASLADSAHRLRVRGVTARGQALVWAIVAAWVLIACLVVLRIDLGGDFDPLPTVALGVWLLTVLIAYGRLKAVFAGLSRTPPPVLVTLLPMDIIAFGVVWWRLLDLSTARQDLDRTAVIVLVCAGLLALGVATAAWFTGKGNAAIDERLRRLETQHRQHVEGEAPSAEWLQRRANQPSESA